LDPDQRPIGLVAMQTPKTPEGLNGTSTNTELTIAGRWVFKYTAANSIPIG